MSTPAQTPSNDQLLQENGIAPVPEGQGAEPTQLQREYVIQTETGQTYKGKTQAEVIEQLKKAVEEGTKTIAQFNREKKAVVEQPKVESAPQFDQNKYWELMGQDPLAADEYKDSFKPGYRQLKETVEEFKTQRTIDTFKAKHDDLPLDSESLTKFENLYNEFNMPLSVKSLELVWAYAKMNGILTPVSQQQQATTNAPTPPPTIDGAATDGMGGINPNEMSIDQLRELIERGQKT